MFLGKNTYGDFIKSAEGIATNILATRLLALEENGIIEKLEHPDSKAKNLYLLTQKGVDLLPLLVEIYLWSDKYFSVPAEIKAQIKEAKKDKNCQVKKLTKELTTQIKKIKNSN